MRYRDETEVERGIQVVTKKEDFGDMARQRKIFISHWNYVICW